MFIVDSSGKKSLTATLAVVAFAVVMLKILFAGWTLTLGPISYSGAGIDAATVGVILTPILGAYTARRWNDSPVLDDPGSKPGDGAT